MTTLITKLREPEGEPAHSTKLNRALERNYTGMKATRNPEDYREITLILQNPIEPDQLKEALADYYKILSFRIFEGETPEVRAALRTWNRRQEERWRQLAHLVGLTKEEGKEE